VRKLGRPGRSGPQWRCAIGAAAGQPVVLLTARDPGSSPPMKVSRLDGVGEPQDRLLPGLALQG
jgi:hypothetical protein